MSLNRGNIGCQPCQLNRVPPRAPRYQNILGHTSSPACKGNQVLAEEDHAVRRNKLFKKELESLDRWRICKKPWCDKGIYRTGREEIDDPPIPLPKGCGCSDLGLSPCESADAILNVAKALDGKSCSVPGPFNILSYGRSPCEYGQRRMWGAANEPLLTTTCGDILPKPNSHRRTNLQPMDRIEQIYRHCDGMLPNYTGDVPGQRYRFGNTFTVSTRNPHGAIEPRKYKPYCYPVPIFS